MAGSIFDALNTLVKAKKPITAKSARDELGKLFAKPITAKFDSKGPNIAAMRAKLVEIKTKAEWQNVALAVHVLHTTCRSCHYHTESTEDLLLKQFSKSSKSFRYLPLKTTEGNSDMPYIALHRQVTVPICHRCMPVGAAVQLQPEDQRQMSFDFPLLDRIAARVAHGSAA